MTGKVKNDYPDLVACARAMQKAKAFGFNVYHIAKLAVGDKEPHPHDDIIIDVYREALEGAGVKCVPPSEDIA